MWIIGFEALEIASRANRVHSAAFHAQLLRPLPSRLLSADSDVTPKSKCDPESFRTDPFGLLAPSVENLTRIAASCLPGDIAVGFGVSNGVCEWIECVFGVDAIELASIEGSGVAAKVLGYDVVDLRRMTSGLFGIEYNDEDRSLFESKWPARSVAEGLLQDYGQTVDYAIVRGMMVPAHAPFTPLAVIELQRIP